MIAVLRVDGSGRVIAANDVARVLLGGVIGQRCCDAVLARSGRELACEPACAVALARGGAATCERRVLVRERLSVVQCSRVGDGVVVVLVPGPDEPLAEVLTPRERETLALVAQGLPTRAIASRLGLHPSTVRTHVEHAREKLGAHTRAEAVARAIARGEL